MLNLERIVELAKEYQTPMYIFDKDELSLRIQDIKGILGNDVMLCFAMKANPFLTDAFKSLDTKYEVCSPGEFAICERENIDLSKIVLSGVNKEKTDIEHVLDIGGVGMYTVESMNQFNLLNECASEKGVKLPVLLRVTSGNQFGLDESDIDTIVKNRSEYTFVEIKGIQCYSGTQKKKPEIMAQELEWLDGILERLKSEFGFEAEELEYGPGLPYNYFGDDAYNNNFEFLSEFEKALRPLKKKYKITLEMGRFLTSSCGVYVSSVADIKVNKNQQYVIIDGGINHVNYFGQTMAMKIPAYSYVKKDGTVIKNKNLESTLKGSDDEKWTVCGSLCTVADVLVKNLPIGNPQVGDMLIFYNIGAYSVTEGIYLFLSRKMPLIIATEGNNVEIYREVMPSDIINTRDNCK